MSHAPILDESHIGALMNARHGDPFSVLGPHPARGGGLILRALLPGASRVIVVTAADGEPLGELDRIHEDGLFEASLPDAAPDLRYRLRVTWGETTRDIEDPYRFPAVLGEYDIWLLAEGTHHRPFERLGAHTVTLDGVEGVYFAVWAPNAERVSVVGDFNHWDGRRHPMRFRHGIGVWELFLPDVGPGALYKYEIVGGDGTLLPLKADPYGFAAELRPAQASVVAEMPPPVEPLSAARQAANARDAPIAVYELHLGSWARPTEGGAEYLSYSELADRLVPYVRELGFTHIELLPVSEYPFDGSWGYQPVGLYAPTRRFGPPEAFRAFVARCHEAGIGVIVDWVPGHFPTDAHGLAEFDGTHLYEHADPRQGFHRDWNTLIFNYGRREVRNYLIGNALYWLERYGVDGLRVDAVASMLYLDYSREDDWVPNEYGGNENLDAIGFLKDLNRIIGTERPGAMMIAEESTAWPGVSQPPEHGGLGFHYKWNMGWMNDSLEYMQRDPAHRCFHQNEITFSLVYAFDENFILPLSHDEVVHGKGSILGRMPGDEWQRFANLRAYYAFMFAHPGKKLLFMGDEFGQPDEWDYNRGLDWGLLEAPFHQGIHRVVSELNALYRALPALHGADCDPAGFRWIDHSDHAQSVLSFVRQSSGKPSEHAVCVFNFTPVVRHDYRIGVPSAADYRERLNTDAGVFGGSGVGADGDIRVKAEPAHGFDQSISMTLPPLAGVILTPTGA